HAQPRRTKTRPQPAVSGAPRLAQDVFPLVHEDRTLVELARKRSEIAGHEHVGVEQRDRTRLRPYGAKQLELRAHRESLGAAPRVEALSIEKLDLYSGAEPDV